MRSFAVVHFDGPSGGGKTAFIEAVLGMHEAFIACLRAKRVPLSIGFEESRGVRSAELLRYVGAGATDDSLLHFDQANRKAFLDLRVTSRDFDAIVIEGDNPAEYADLTIFVGSPPNDGMGLVRTGLAAPPDEDFSQDRLYATHSPLGFARLLREKLGDGFLSALHAYPKLPKLSGLGRRSSKPFFVQEPRSSPEPKAGSTKHVLPAYLGLEHAGICVITVQDAAGRDAAAKFADEVRAMRSDPALRREIFGRPSPHYASTIVAADLRDPNDPGTKKALSRVRRALRSILERRR